MIKKIYIFKPYRQELNLHHISFFKEKLVDKLQKKYHIILDVENVEEIPSSFVGIIIICLKNYGNDCISIINMSSKLYSIFSNVIDTIRIEWDTPLLFNSYDDIIKFLSKDKVLR